MRNPHFGTASSSNVRNLGFAGDDCALVRALRRGDPGAPATLFDRYGPHVQRVVANVMGVDAELADILHEVFARALDGIDTLRDEQALKAWLTSTAVNTARSWIRARTRRRWLRLSPTDDLPEGVAPTVSDEVREAMHATYSILDKMNADLHIVFSLRFILQLELAEVAAACGISLATTKRRISKAEKRFVLLARREPALAHWVAEGSRWGSI